MTNAATASSAQSGLPDFTLPVAITAQMIASLAVDIIAQSVGNLKVDIAAQSLSALNVNIASQSVTLNVNISSQSVTLNVNISSQSTTLNVNVTNSSLTVNVSGTVNVNIASQSTTLNVNISSQSVTLNVNVTNSTLNVNISGSSVTLNVNITGATATLNINVVSGIVSLSNVRLLEQAARKLLSTSANGSDVLVYKVPADKTAYIVAVDLHGYLTGATTEGAVWVYIYDGVNKYTLLYRYISSGQVALVDIAGVIAKMNSNEELHLYTYPGLYAEINVSIAEV